MKNIVSSKCWPHAQWRGKRIYSLIIKVVIHWTLTLFRLAQRVQWIFEISTCDVMTADYKIIMSRTLKVTGYHVIHVWPQSIISKSKAPGKRGHTVADTLLLMMFLGRVNAWETQSECCFSMLCKLGNICCGHKMFLNKIKNIFCVPDKNVPRAGKRGNICVRNNVSSFARALIMSSSHGSCCLPSCQWRSRNMTSKFLRSMYNKAT